MHRAPVLIVSFICFSALFLCCYAPALFFDRQFGYRDAGHYYYPLNQLVQEEWNQGRWPLWETEENAGMPLLGNPTAAVLYPGKVIFALMPYAWAARVYIMAHSALAFVSMLILMRSWGTSTVGSTLAALAYAFGAPILFQYCNIIYLIGAAWLPLGVCAVDRWVRLGRRSGLLELTIVLAMLVLGGDPQIAYLLGLIAVGYSWGIVWSRSRPIERREKSEARSFGSRLLLGVGVVVAFLAWFAITVALAQWLPTFRAPGKPAPPLVWMVWVPPAVTAIAGLIAVVLTIYWAVRWWKTGARSPLGVMWFGLACAAALAISVTAAQLLPVVEFTQRTARAAEGGTHEIYVFSVEPYRLIEMIWPNILGETFSGNTYWGQIIRLPGSRPKVWVPSLYAGGLTLVLALGSLAFRHGPPWRVCFSVIVVISVLGSLGSYTSPIWATRAVASYLKSDALDAWISKLGVLDPADATPIRLDGHLRDGDGGFYWWLSTVLPGFRQFRFPAKLFTLTNLALAALAGVGWDRALTGRARGIGILFAALAGLSLFAVGATLWSRTSIVATFQGLEGTTLFGPFDAAGGYRSLLKSLVQGAVVFTLGTLLVLSARRRPTLAGAAAVILMTVDLAVANAQFVLTVPQSLFDTKPEIAKIIEQAEREKPNPAPYRVHRMPIWSPLGWQSIPSKDRVFELVKWEHDTVQPKHGINNGITYTYTMGVAELYDYEWYFNGFPWRIHDPEMARVMGVNLGKEVVYFPRRSYDMWNTRYFIVPYWHGGWRDEYRGYASFLFETERVYPESNKFRNVAGGDELEKRWIETTDFKILRNLQEFPRAWVVHNARMTRPLTGLSPASRSEAFQEMLYAGDRIWNDPTQRAYDPHSIAWVSSDDIVALRPFLSGDKSRPSETVTIEYPDPQHAKLEVTLDSPGIVVLADVYYPGWKLTIDDKPAPLYRVNGIMRGAAVSAGHHRIAYEYAPRSFAMGCQVSLMGIAVFVILGLASLRWPVDGLLEEPPAEPIAQEIPV
jgi:hypothetical protein